MSQVETPILVNPDPTPAQFMVAVRSVLVMLGTYLVTRGWISDAELQVVVGALIVIGPFVWQQVRARRNTAKLTVLAQRVPDSVARVEGK